MIDLGTYLDLIIANLSLGQQLIVVAVIHDGNHWSRRRGGVTHGRTVAARLGLVARRIDNGGG
ncbi:hypothetical protein, partial [Aeromonas allosaccharophila]|uniref:hypothetical protein n=1 Tax=Aeromonas allosaccharophila TaxID=656 RepID=UPI003D1B37AC